jgi:hypothetical protein
MKILKAAWILAKHTAAMALSLIKGVFALSAQERLAKTVANQSSPTKIGYRVQTDLKMCFTCEHCTGTSATQLECKEHGIPVSIKGICKRDWQLIKM